MQTVFCRETYDQYHGLEAQCQTVTREISAEMENNEKLTVNREKLSDELKRTRRIIDGQKERVEKLEDQLMEVIKQLEASQETCRNLFNVGGYFTFFGLNLLLMHFH